MRETSPGFTMSINTDIQWCDSTANPAMGCCGCELRSDKLSVCYAGNDHDRKKGWIAKQSAKSKATGYAREFEDVTRFPGRVAEAARWSGLHGLAREDKPWLTGGSRMIFLSDMGDALSPHKSIYVDREYRPVEPNTDWMYLLTEVVKNASSPEGRHHVWLWLSKQMHRAIEFEQWLRAIGVPWPSNLWLGTSVTEMKFLYRVDQLLSIGDASMTRFLSIEPQVAPIELRDQLKDRRIAWVIQGGESGARAARLHLVEQHIARPFDLDWARAMLRECRQADVAYFLKQLGSNPIDNGKPLLPRDSHGGDWREWPIELAVREVPGVDPRWSRR